MSSVVSGITKVFASVGTGLAKLGTAVKAVGASFFSAGGSSAGSLFSSAAGSTSTLGNIFSGIKSVLSIGPFGAIGDALSASATALAGTGGGAAGGGFWKGLGKAFSNPEVVSGLVAGAGAGLGSYLEMQAYKDMQERNIAAAAETVQKRQDSYNNLPVFASTQAAVDNGVQTAAAPAASTTANAYAKFNETKEKEIWAYNPETGMVEKKKVSRQPAATSMVA